MNNVKTTTNEKAIINIVNGTPFIHIQDKEKNYIGCIHTKMETKWDIDEVRKRAKNIDWKLIGLYVEAIMNEYINNDEKNK